MFRRCGELGLVRSALQRCGELRILKVPFRPKSCLNFWRIPVNQVPSVRIAAGNDRSTREDGRYVLYWMIASRRLNYNFALDRAMEHSRELGKPLVVFEALRCGYEWASDRLHRFVLDGMADNAKKCAQHGVEYFCYVEARAGDGKGLLEALAAEACVVVTDEFPCFFLPRMVAAAGKKIAGEAGSGGFQRAVAVAGGWPSIRASF